MKPAAYRMFRLREVGDLTGLSRSTIWRKVREGTFPRPVMIGERTPVWAEPDIARYQEELRAAAGLPAFVDAA